MVIVLLWVVSGSLIGYPMKPSLPWNLGEAVAQQAFRIAWRLGGYKRPKASAPPGTEVLRVAIKHFEEKAPFGLNIFICQEYLQVRQND